MESRTPGGAHRARIFDEAAEWIVELREGEIDAAARVAFQRWLRTSPEHIEAFLELAAVWEDLPSLIRPEQIDVQAMIDSARVEANVIELAGRRSAANAASSAATPAQARGVHPRTAAARRWLTAAAIIIATTVGGLTVWYAAFGGERYTTGIGEQRSLMLADGSTLEMNACSSVRVRMSAHERDVVLLAGQALFSVAKDPTRPFVVRSGRARIRAVGTEFDVYRHDSATNVTVVEGRVAVSASGTADSTGSTLPPAQSSDKAVHLGMSVRRDSILVQAGEQVTVSGSRLGIHLVNVTAVTAWTQRQVVFQGTPLLEVVEQFNRYNERQMVLTDPSLNGIRVSGIFSSTKPDSLLRFLAEQVGLDVTVRPREVRISPR